MCFFSVSMDSRQTDKIAMVYKEHVTIVPKNAKVFIHASVLTLSVIHIHSHTLKRWNPTTTTLWAEVSSVQPRLVMLERPPGGATIRWPDRRGTLSSVCAPDRLKLDWWRLRIGGGWWEVGDVLADGAGVMYLGVGMTSYTGPSYIPRITPCLPLTWFLNLMRW